MALPPILVDTGLVSQATVRVHQRNGMTTCAERRADTHRMNGLACRASHYLEGTSFSPLDATRSPGKRLLVLFESEPLLKSYKNDNMALI